MRAIIRKDPSTRVRDELAQGEPAEGTTAPEGAASVRCRSGEQQYFTTRCGHQSASPRRTSRAAGGFDRLSYDSFVSFFAFRGSSEAFTHLNSTINQHSALSIKHSALSIEHFRRRSQCGAAEPGRLALDVREIEAQFVEVRSLLGERARPLGVASTLRRLGLQ